MTENFRALCAEFVEALKDENTYTQRIELIGRARAALAEQPVELSDEELWAIWNPHDGPIPAVLRAAIAADRAANARWGQP